MYSTAKFRADDLVVLQSFIQAHPFGTLIAQGPDGSPVIAHAPCLLDTSRPGAGRLRLHLARGNPAVRAALDGKGVTVVFQGADAYVSASWYEHPELQVPTWNYVVVHAHGRAQGPMEGPALLQLLDDLAGAFEGNSARRWTRELVAPELTAQLCEAIVGFDIELDTLEGSFKLSQNRSPADRRRVAAALEHRGRPDDAELASLMRSMGIAGGRAAD